MAVDRILMIVSDTVRTDMLGYNGGGVRTPNLDRLAAKSMVSIAITRRVFRRFLRATIT